MAMGLASTRSDASITIAPEARSPPPSATADRRHHGQGHGQTDGEEESVRDLGRPEGQQHGEPEPDRR